MELVATYLALGENLLNETMDLIDNRDNEEEVSDQIEELLNDEDIDILEMDQYWDVFHYLLNKVSASEPLPTELLSQVILGCSRADTDDYIAMILPEQVSQIVHAISQIDIDKLLSILTVESLSNANVYPNHWDKIDINELKEILKITFDDLIIFYQEVHKANKGILVTIL